MKPEFSIAPIPKIESMRQDVASVPELAYYHTSDLDVDYSSQVLPAPSQGFQDYFIQEPLPSDPYMREIVFRAAVNNWDTSGETLDLKYRLTVAAHLYFCGVHFLLPVYFGTKVRAWQPAFTPIRWQTAQHLAMTNKIGKKRGYEPYAYDLAVQTGSWQFPAKTPDRCLVVFDVDDWDSVGAGARMALETTRTFVIRTKRGFHFYYWVSKSMADSLSSSGLEWLGRNRMAVLTGADRYVVHWYPIAYLPDAHAKSLRSAVRHHQTLKTRLHFAKPHQDRALEVGEGERNYYINATLYRHRDLPADQLRSKALELAASTNPPYPNNEALQIAASILRNRHRFPTATDTGLLVDLSLDKRRAERTAYLRLGLYMQKPYLLFTLQDYEANLERQGWDRNRDGRIAAARQDIEHNLKMGEIMALGSEPSSSGRPRNLYMRVRAFEGEADYILPTKPTALNFRLSKMMSLLPKQPHEVVRRTLATHVGVGSTRSINRYAKLLEDGTRWGAPLLIRQEQTPYISVSMLSPKHAKVWPLPRDQYYQLREFGLNYRPSLYQTTSFYHTLMQQSRLYPRLPDSAKRGVMVGGYAVEAYSQTYFESQEGSILAEMEPNRQEQEVMGNLMPTPDFYVATESPLNLTSLAEAWQEKTSCIVCGAAMEGQEGACKKCDKKIKRIREKRLQYDYSSPTKWITDYCEKTYRFFKTDVLPLRGVHPDVEKDYFPHKPPVIFRYCPDPTCNAQIHTGFYDNYVMPFHCPQCHQMIANNWRSAPAVPEHKLTGYPHNIYTKMWKPLFEVLDQLWEIQSRGIIDGPLAKAAFYMRQLVSEECYLAWRASLEPKIKTFNLECPRCHEVMPIEGRIGKPAPEINLCPSCYGAVYIGKLFPHPPSETTPLSLETQASKAYSRYTSLFGQLNEKQRNQLNDLAIGYPLNWVFMAMMVIKNADVLSHNRILKMILKKLIEWGSAGYHDDTTVDSIFADCFVPDYAFMFPAEAAIHLVEDPYLACQIFFEPLDHRSAEQLRVALEIYGKQAVLRAITQAVSDGVRVWSYCQAVLDYEELDRRALSSVRDYSTSTSSMKSIKEVVASLKIPRPILQVAPPTESPSSNHPAATPEAGRQDAEPTPPPPPDESAWQPPPAPPLREPEPQQQPLKSYKLSYDDYLSYVFGTLSDPLQVTFYDDLAKKALETDKHNDDKNVKMVRGFIKRYERHRQKHPNKQGDRNMINWPSPYAEMKIIEEEVREFADGSDRLRYVDEDKYTYYAYLWAYCTIKPIADERVLEFSEIYWRHNRERWREGAIMVKAMMSPASYQEQYGENGIKDPDREEVSALRAEYLAEEWEIEHEAFIYAKACVALISMEQYMQRFGEKDPDYEAVMAQYAKLYAEDEKEIHEAYIIAKACLAFWSPEHYMQRFGEKDPDFDVVIALRDEWVAEEKAIAHQAFIYAKACIALMSFEEYMERFGKKDPDFDAVVALYTKMRDDEREYLKYCYILAKALMSLHQYDTQYRDKDPDAHKVLFVRNLMELDYDGENDGWQYWIRYTY